MRGEVCMVALMMAASSGCFLDRSPIADGGSLDAALIDAGPDAAPADAAHPDSGPRDAGPFDAGRLDAGSDGGPVDGCVPTAELCNGVDDDCNPATPDGADEVTLGEPCDSDDDDLCSDDAFACVGGALSCVDDGSDVEELEICNGLDDDCNPATVDGSQASMWGQPCDGADDDLCEDDSFVCVGGGLACADDGSDAEEAELCNGVDDDCDGRLDEDGADDPTLGMACDGPDADECRGGTLSCAAGAPVCSDSPGDTPEAGCNGADEDCDGSIDEGLDCGCDRVEFAAHAYLFCDASGDRRDWSDARDFCRARGYELVAIESIEEQRFVGDEARRRRSDRGFWIGANDRDDEGSFEWEDDPPRPLSFTNWNPEEPNDSFGEDCVVLTPQDETSPGLYGGWNDLGCNGNQRFVCEAGP